MNYPPPINPALETKKITSFIKNTFKKAGKASALIAVSGGIDSSSTLLLTSKALNPKGIRVLILPAKTTDPIDLEHANLATGKAKIPEVNIDIINITGIVQKVWRVIKRQTHRDGIAISEGDRIFAANYGQAESLAIRTINAKQTGPNLREQKNADPRNAAAKKIAVTRAQVVPKHTPDRRKINQEIARINRIRLANLAARIRMLVIYDHAKRLDALVVGTENHSEHLLGYYTRFGDEASDLEPIKHLYKTQVRELATYLKVPKQIIAKAPTAGLWPGQTDAGELGFSYEEADPILYLKFEQNLSPAAIVKKLASDTQKTKKETETLVKKVLGWVEKTAFKHQVPFQL